MQNKGKNSDKRLRNNQFEIRVDGREVVLTRNEFVVFEDLYSKLGEPVERRELLNKMFFAGSDSWSRAVDVYVGYLRRKIGKANIVTVKGIGYALVGKNEYQILNNY